MRNGIRIGKIFGVNINVDWSWMSIFLLVIWNLAVVFGQTHPDWGLGARWSLAVIAPLLFFASVLAHELAHSLVAKAQGAARPQHHPLSPEGCLEHPTRTPSPRAEFLITTVGPLTSFVIGFVLTLAGGLTTTAAFSASVATPMELVSQFSPTATILLWLGWINILLAVFDLIPGFSIW